jgi:hypothetical protein
MEAIAFGPFTSIMWGWVADICWGVFFVYGFSGRALCTRCVISVDKLFLKAILVQKRDCYTEKPNDLYIMFPCNRAQYSSYNKLNADRILSSDPII